MIEFIKNWWNSKIDNSIDYFLDNPDSSKEDLDLALKCLHFRIDDKFKEIHHCLDNLKEYYK